MFSSYQSENLPNNSKFLQKFSPKTPVAQISFPYPLNKIGTHNLKKSCAPEYLVTSPLFWYNELLFKPDAIFFYILSAWGNFMKALKLFTVLFYVLDTGKCEASKILKRSQRIWAQFPTINKSQQKKARSRKQERATLTMFMFVSVPHPTHGFKHLFTFQLQSFSKSNWICEQIFWPWYFDEFQASNGTELPWRLHAARCSCVVYDKESNVKPSNNNSCLRKTTCAIWYRSIISCVSPHS